MKQTTRTIRRMKGRQPVVAVTAYDTLIGALASQAGADLILVGDSLGTTYLGFDTTVPVNLDMMIHHTAAVSRARPESLLVADLPFPEGRRAWPDLLEASSRLMKEGGAEAVKLEGGVDVAESVARLVATGIPVLGHIGLLPQSYYAMGGYRKFGKKADEAESLVADAVALEEAGVFAVIVEMVEAEVTRRIRDAIGVPLIGIGAGPHCDGQILVCSDMLGLSRGYIPTFVKTYANLNETIGAAFRSYAEEVREGRYPL